MLQPRGYANFTCVVHRIELPVVGSITTPTRLTRFYDGSYELIFSLRQEDIWEKPFPNHIALTGPQNPHVCEYEFYLVVELWQSWKRQRRFPSRRSLLLFHSSPS
jgi:hypothetical protein